MTHRERVTRSTGSVRTAPPGQVGSIVATAPAANVSPVSQPGCIDTLLDGIVAVRVDAAAARLSRPLYVTQRTVAAVVGLPARDYLRAARGGAFASLKQRRLVLAKTVDVAAWLEDHPVTPRQARASNEGDAFDAALASVGARRVGAPR